MPLKDYGVWVGFPVNFEAETKDRSPHLQLHFSEDKDATTGKIRAAVNIKSSTKEEARLVYWFKRNFEHPITDSLADLEPGFHRRSEQVPGLDFIRGNLFQISEGVILEHNRAGANNDIIDFISPVLTQAIEQKATLYIYGEPFHDAQDGEDGIHDVHMNQGNTGRFANDNGVFQDGGILLRFPDGHWEAIFLAFGVQKIHTDDETGNPISDRDFVDELEGTPGGGPGPVKEDDGGDGDGSTRPPPPPPSQPSPLQGSVFIRAALVNPVGADQQTTGQPETVYLHNRSTDVVNLDRATLLNRSKQRQALKGLLEAGSSKGFEVPDAPLSNNGGTITLLDFRDLKVDGVSYTRAQAQREGNFIYFH